MNYDKIGKFIYKKRKDMGFTQEDLASKLSITDRAVSRWERGKSCPDISLLEDLSNILNVQVIEILHGESIIKDENKAILDILKLKNKETLLWKIIAYVFLNILLFIFLIILIISYFATQDKKQNISVIVSPSMSPNFNMFDIVIIKKTSFEEIKINDVVAYYS